MPMIIVTQSIPPAGGVTAPPVSGRNKLLHSASTWCAMDSRRARPSSEVQYTHEINFRRRDVMYIYAAFEAIHACRSLSLPLLLFCSARFGRRRRGRARTSVRFSYQPG